MEVNEGDWVDFISNGEIHRGQIERKFKDKPFGADNFWIVVNGSCYQPGSEYIIKVYEKVTFAYNPSSR